MANTRHGLSYTTALNNRPSLYGRYAFSLHIAKLSTVERGHRPRLERRRRLPHCTMIFAASLWTPASVDNFAAPFRYRLKVLSSAQVLITPMICLPLLRRSGITYQSVDLYGSLARCIMLAVSLYLSWRDAPNSVFGRYREHSRIRQ